MDRSHLKNHNYCHVMEEYRKIRNIVNQYTKVQEGNQEDESDYNYMLKTLREIKCESISYKFQMDYALSVMQSLTSLVEDMVKEISNSSFKKSRSLLKNLETIKYETTEFMDTENFNSERRTLCSKLILQLETITAKK